MERSNWHQRQQGFTLIELIAVLIILAIMAAVAISRVGDNSAIELSVQADILKSHLRYAQIRAMNSGDPDTPNIWGISSNGSQYWLFDSGDTSSVVRLPGSDNNQVTPSGGVAIPAFTVAFDFYGRPLSNPAAPGSLLASNMTFNLTAGGASEAVTITRNTGFIQ